MSALRLVVVASLFLLTACDQPTAADLARASYRIERQLIDDIENPASAWHGFGMDGVLNHLPVVGQVEFRLDGRRKKYRGFVFERVLVRPDGRSLPCPLVARSLMAADGEQGFLLHSAEGPTTIQKLEGCSTGLEYAGYTSIVSHGTAALIVVDGRLRNRYGKSGPVDLRLESLGAACDWVDMYYTGDDPLDVLCEVATYRVRAEASLVTEAVASSPVTGRFQVPEQTVPGFRLTIRCNHSTVDFAGCDPWVEP